MSADGPFLRIAMIGQRGVPATYGGVERHVEELGSRLVEMGHEVIVYCRPTYSPERLATYRGMQLRHMNAPESKHFEAIVHSAEATAWAMHEHVDVIHYHALGPGLVAPLPRRFSRAKVVQTVHGLDHERAKWGRMASAVLRFGGWLSARTPNATIGVSQELVRHYSSTYGRDIHYICNGVDIDASPPDDTTVLDGYGLTAGAYVLFVGRLVPEKQPAMLVEAFARLDRPDIRLAVAGANSFTMQYVVQLEETAARDPRVAMLGNVHRSPLQSLYANAAVFVLPSDVEGMPLTLLEATAHGIPILVSDIAPHRELLGSDGPGRRFFKQGDQDDLLATLQAMLADLPAERAGATATASRVRREFSWDRAAVELDELYRSLVKRPRSRGASRPPAELSTEEPADQMRSYG